MADSIDIFKEYSSLIRREQVLAVFDFEHSTKSGPPLHGLCRISKPRAGESGLNYVGVLLMIDLPDPGSWKEVNQLAKSLDSASLGRHLKQLAKVIDSPALNLSPEISVKEVDLVMQPGFVPGHEYIEGELVPAICAVAKLKAEALLWCDTLSKEPADQVPVSSENSLFFKLKDWITGRLKGE
jgi:hypothetical protein